MPAEEIAVRSDELHKRFCYQIASGKSLRQSCADMGFSAPFITEWHREDSAAASRYAHACEARGEMLADELVELADSAQEATIMGEDGEDVALPRIDPARVQAIKLAVDTRKWVASKLHRTKYGDQPAGVTLNVGIAVNIPEDRRAKIMELRRARGLAEVIPVEDSQK